jgi:hypothetical protein
LQPCHRRVICGLGDVAGCSCDWRRPFLSDFPVDRLLLRHHSVRASHDAQI